MKFFPQYLKLSASSERKFFGAMNNAMTIDAEKTKGINA